MNIQHKENTPLVTYPVEGGAIATAGYSDVTRTAHFEERYTSTAVTPSTSNKSTLLIVSLAGTALISTMAGVIIANSLHSTQLQQAQAEANSLKLWRHSVQSVVCQ